MTFRETSINQSGLCVKDSMFKVREKNIAKLVGATSSEHFSS